MFVLILLFAILGCPSRKDAASNGAEGVDSALVEDTLDFTSGEWITDYDLAVKYAQNSGLPIMINFTGSDWCGWCIKLKEEVFSQKEFKDYAKENLILLEIDFPRNKEQTLEMKQKNAQIRDRFGVRGYPTIVFMDKYQKEINRTGYQYGGAVAYVEHIKALLTVKK